jgi:hypothetical protein
MRTFPIYMLSPSSWMKYVGSKIASVKKGTYTFEPARCRQRFPETLVSSFKTKRCHNPEDHIL